METKKEIRARALKERGSLQPEARASFDQKIHKLAADHPFFLNAGRFIVMLFSGNSIT